MEEDERALQRLAEVVDATGARAGDAVPLVHDHTGSAAEVRRGERTLHGEGGAHRARRVVERVFWG